MKFAFLISGRSRNYIYQTQTFYDKVFKLVDADIYVSFQKDSRLFNDPEEVSKKIPIHLRINMNDKVDDKEFLTNLFGDRLKYFSYDDEDYIQEIVNKRLDQIKLNISSNRESTDEKTDYQRIYYTLDQYTRVKNISEKFESNKKIDYDIVVRLRLDQLFWIDEYNLINNISNKNKIYFNFREDWIKSQLNNNPNWVKDFFFFGNQEKMIYIMKNFIENIYTDIDYIQKDNLHISPEIQLAIFINHDLKIRDHIQSIKILDSQFYHVGMYRSGYYLGKKENIERYLRSLK